MMFVKAVASLALLAVLAPSVVAQRVVPLKISQEGNLVDVSGLNLTTQQFPFAIRLMGNVKLMDKIDNGTRMFVTALKQNTTKREVTNLTDISVCEFMQTNMTYWSTIASMFGFPSSCPIKAGTFEVDNAVVPVDLFLNMLSVSPLSQFCLRLDTRLENAAGKASKVGLGFQVNPTSGVLGIRRFKTGGFNCSRLLGL